MGKSSSQVRLAERSWAQWANRIRGEREVEWSTQKPGSRVWKTGGVNSGCWYRAPHTEGRREHFYLLPQNRKLTDQTYIYHYNYKSDNLSFMCYLLNDRKNRIITNFSLNLIDIQTKFWKQETSFNILLLRYT